MNAHTQGPWKTYGKGGVEPVNAPRYELNDGWIIADCPGPDAKANAQLVAAAPDLLEALEHALHDAQSRLYMLPVKAEQIERDIITAQIRIYSEPITRATGRERGE